MPAPPPFFSANQSRKENKIAPAINAIIVTSNPTNFSASTTISNIAAAIKIPAPKEVRAKTALREKFILLAIYMPRKDVKPAKDVNAIV